VLFSWADEATAEQIKAIPDELAKMPQAIGQIRSYQYGPNAGISDNFDYGLVADFDSEADYTTYRDHPVHREMVTRAVRPIVKARAAIQYEV
jgi:Stress responsive A/B Barrel Domain